MSTVSATAREIAAGESQSYCRSVQYSPTGAAYAMVAKIAARMIAKRMIGQAVVARGFVGVLLGSAGVQMLQLSLRGHCFI